MGRRYILKPSERETIIRRADDEDFWHVYTESPSFAKRLEKLLRKSGILYKKNDAGAIRCMIPLSCIRFASLPSESTRIRQKERMEQLRGRGQT
jgi:hypothetical protein